MDCERSPVAYPNAAEPLMATSPNTKSINLNNNTIDNNTAASNQTPNGVQHSPIVDLDTPSPSSSSSTSSTSTSPTSSPSSPTTSSAALPPPFHSTTSQHVHYAPPASPESPDDEESSIDAFITPPTSPDHPEQDGTITTTTVSNSTSTASTATLMLKTTTPDDDDDGGDGGGGVGDVTPPIRDDADIPVAAADEEVVVDTEGCATEPAAAAAAVAVQSAVPVAPVMRLPPVIVMTTNVGPKSVANKTGGTTTTTAVATQQRPRGLSNIGNTCFFNACMQCLSQTPYLTAIFKDEVVVMPGGTFTPSPPKDAPNGSSTDTDATPVARAEPQTMQPIRIAYSADVDELLKEFKSVMEQMQMSGGTINPNRFFHRFSNQHQQFSGGDQHDSHELLRHLLDSVLVAERRIYKDELLKSIFNGRKFKSLDASELQIYEFYAGQAKERFLIRRLFQGTLESTLRCEECGHTSPNMETFLDISLPVVAAPTVSTASSVAATNGRSPVSAAASNGDDNHYTVAPRKSPERPQLTQRQQKRNDKKEKRKANNANKRNKNGPKGAAAEEEEKDDGMNGEAANDKETSEIVDGETAPHSEAESRDTVDKVATDGVSENSNSDGEADNSDRSSTSSTNDPKDGVTNEPTKQTFGAFCLRSPDSLALLLKKHGGVCGSLSNGSGSSTSSTSSFSSASGDINTIGMPYETKSGECSVQSSLNAFIAAELLSGSNKVTCEACTTKSHTILRLQQQRQQQQQQQLQSLANGDGDKNGGAGADDDNNNDNNTASGGAAAKPKPLPSVLTNATKQFLISALPAVLILHLKRFQIGHRHRVQKIHDSVEFPLVLDMGPFCAASPQLGHRFRTIHPAQRSILYALYGVVVHQGSMGSGHYVAYVKVRPQLAAGDRRWKFVSTREAEQRQRDKQQQCNGTEAMAEKTTQSAPTNASVAATLLNGGGGGGGGGQQHSTTAADTSYDSDDSLTGEQLERRARVASERLAVAEALAAEQANVEAPPGKWFYVSDSRVTEVSERDVLKAQAYLLFYERIF